MALSLFSAASVYIYSAKSDPKNGLSTADLQNLKFLIQAMEGIGRKHLITQAFLQQVFMDVHRNGLSSVIDLPNLDHYKSTFGWTYSNIPLLARSSVSKHTEIQPPLPGRLPLGNPKGTAYDHHQRMDVGVGGGGCHGQVISRAPFTVVHIPPDETSFENNPNKRKRTSMTASPDADGDPGTAGLFNGTFHSSSNAQSAQLPLSNGIEGAGGFATGLLRASGFMPKTNLPHRTNSGAASPSSILNHSTPSQSTSSRTTPPEFDPGSASTEQGISGDSISVSDNFSEIIDITSIRNHVAGATSTWDSRGLQYAPSTDAISFADLELVGGIDPWNMLTSLGDMDWTNPGGGDTLAGSDLAGLGRKE